MSARLLLSGLAGLLVVALGAALYLAEWKEVQLPGPPSAEAQRNPYLAAERFLDRMAVAVHRVEGLSLLDDLPSTEGVIVIGSSLRTVSERRVDALLRWVAAGGRLVLAASELHSEGRRTSPDPVLELLGLRLHEVEEVEEEDAAQQQTLKEVIEGLAEAYARCDAGERLTTLHLEGEAAPVQVIMSNRRRLDFEPLLEYPAAANDAGDQLVAAPHGLGRVYVVTTLAFWRNDQIACHDHAHLLRWLGEGRAGVWLLFDTQMPSLVSILWQRYTVAVGILLVLVMMWIWRGGRTRSVPVAQSGPRRSLLEQVRGVARFHWQQGDVRSLMTDLRDSVLSGREWLNETARLEWLDGLSARTGISKDDLRWALEAEIPRDVQKVKRAVRILMLIDQHT